MLRRARPFASSHGDSESATELSDGSSIEEGDYEAIPYQSTPKMFDDMSSASASSPAPAEDPVGEKPEEDFMAPPFSGVGLVSEPVEPMLAPETQRSHRDDQALTSNIAEDEFLGLMSPDHK